MSVIFTSFFGKNMPAYAVFLLSGLIIWNFIAQGSTGSITDLINGSWLTGKVFMPKTVFMITAIGSSLVNLLISLIPLAIIVAIQKVSLTAAIAFLPVSLLIIILFTAGLGLISSTLAVFFNDAINIHNIALRIIMYLSGIFYVAESLPIDFQPFVKANPFYNLITLFRDPIYFGRLPDQWTIIYSFIWAIALFSFGVFVFLKFSDQFTYRV
jgi:ABC-type polysaccharide/polyol phosphate export permease